MGYRSDVAIAIDKDTYDAQVLIGVGINAFWHDSKTVIDGAYHWAVNGTRWYLDYPDVSYMESLLAAIEEIPSERDLYGFIRIGEENDDNEMSGDPMDYHLYIVRQIESPLHAENWV